LGLASARKSRYPDQTMREKDDQLVASIFEHFRLLSLPVLFGLFRFDAWDTMGPFTGD
jgi:hypothetical protein